MTVQLLPAGGIDAAYRAYCAEKHEEAVKIAEKAFISARSSCRKEDVDALDAAAERVQSLRGELLNSQLCVPLCRELSRALKIYNKGLGTLSEVQEVVELAGGAAQWGHGQQTALEVAHGFLALQRYESLRLHAATLKATGGAGAAEEAQVHSNELLRLGIAIKQQILQFSGMGCSFVVDQLVPFASRHGYANMGALQEFARALAYAAKCGTSEEALSIVITKAQTCLRSVLEVCVEYCRISWRCLERTGQLLVIKFLPEHFSLPLLAIIGCVRDMTSLLESCAKYGTLAEKVWAPAGFASREFLSNQLSALVGMLAPVLVAFGHTSAAASSVISEDARRLAAAHANDRILQGQDAISRQLAANRRETGEQAGAMMACMTAIQAGVEKLAAAQRGVIVSSRENQSVGSNNGRNIESGGSAPLKIEFAGFCMLH